MLRTYPSPMASVPLLSARDIKKSFGGRLILDGLDLELADGMRVGVLGPNGGGKSTLLAILAGLEEPDGGTVTRRRGLVHAFLPQHVHGDERTPLAWVFAARPELAELEEQLHAVERRLADPALAADLNAIGRALATRSGCSRSGPSRAVTAPKARRATLLDDLGVTDEMLAMPTSELSGGQRKLVALAACLARRPDVLMLDEPEAHLDMHRRDQLERIVDDFDGAVLMVSHDRHLLDACVGAIAELDRGRIRIWPGGYSAYAVARQLELEKQQQQYVTQQKEIARLEEAVRRFRHWAHITVNERAAKQARVKQMQIDKMEKIDRPVLERRKMALGFRSGVRGGQRVIALEAADVAFDPGDPVLLDVELTIMRGERVGVVGPNGAGKTALLRTLGGTLEPAGGERWIGSGIEVGYLSQAAAGLPLDATGDRRAARRPLDGRGHRGAAADGVPVRLRAGPAPRAHAQRRRAHAARVPAADGGRAELPAARRADQPPRHRARSRCSRTRSSTTTAPSWRCPTTAISSTASPTASWSSPTARRTPTRAAGRRTWRASECSERCAVREASPHGPLPQRTRQPDRSEQALLARDAQAHRSRSSATTT